MNAQPAPAPAYCEFVVWERATASVFDILPISAGSVEEAFNIARDFWPTYRDTRRFITRISRRLPDGRMIGRRGLHA